MNCLPLSMNGKMHQDSNLPSQDKDVGAEILPTLDPVLERLQ
jgi:hypothetical protein